jgi:uncharacterized membrane protein YvbJ
LRNEFSSHQANSQVTYDLLEDVSESSDFDSDPNSSEEEFKIKGHSKRKKALKKKKRGPWKKVNRITPFNENIEETLMRASAMRRKNVLDSGMAINESKYWL